MNALEVEMELMDPADYWQMHRGVWHHAGDLADNRHYPQLANFYYDLEEDASWLLSQFGVN